LKKVTDEETLFLEILENGFSRGNHPVFQELLVVAKHIRQTKKFGERNIVKELSSFCEERNQHFNFTLSESLFIKVAKESIKNPCFRKPKFPIYISSDELERIAVVKNFAYQKLMVASLVVARHSGSSNIFSDTTKEIRFIILASGERFSVPKFVEQVTPIAKEIGIFEHVNGRRHFYRLMGDQKGDVQITISTDNELRSIGEIYRNYRGGIKAWCDKCGEEFVKTRNNMRLCIACSESKITKKLKTLDR